MLLLCFSPVLCRYFKPQPACVFAWQTVRLLTASGQSQSQSVNLRISDIATYIIPCRQFLASDSFIYIFPMRSRESMELETQDSSAFAVAPHALPTSDPASDLNPEDPRGLDQQLEPADGGAPAWKVLFAAFMFEALLWGKLLSY